MPIGQVPTPSPINMSKPLISIITVTLNPGAMLKETLDSIASQSFPDCEWIIKDGNSKDGSLEVVKGFARYPVKLEVRPDKSIYDAMNQAVQYAEGEYIHFLNAGDLYAGPEVLAQVAAAIRQAAVKPSIFYTYYRDQMTKSVVTYPARVGRWFLYRNNFCHQAEYFRREDLLAAGGFNVEFPICADRELTLHILRRAGARCQLVPEATITYRGDGFSALPKNLGRRQLEHKRICQTYFTATERAWYELVKILTLHPIRSRMADYPSDNPVYRFYYWLRKIIRKWI